MKDTDEREDYWSALPCTIPCRVTGCSARINNPQLHEKIFHWNRKKDAQCGCAYCQEQRQKNPKGDQSVPAQPKPSGPREGPAPSLARDGLESWT